MPENNDKTNKKKIKMIGNYSKLTPYFIKFFNAVKN